jgi:hypothetical protein
MSKPPVGLVMICKNEEANIERALLSVKPWINTWVIVDTGSTDGTKEVIRRVMGDMPGFLEERPWVNFGANRTEALELCKGRMDWAIMLDADDNMAGDAPPAALWTTTDYDAYAIKIKPGPTIHQRVQIFRIATDWCYQGVLHEYPHCRGVEKPRILLLPANIWMDTRCDGVRSRDPNKYLKDAMALEAEYYRDPTVPRTIFYLAQSYRDAGKPVEAQLWYQKYIDTSGGWDQEYYISIMNLINLISDPKRVMELAWQAAQLCPDRLEVPYVALVRHIQQKWPITQQHYALATLTDNRIPNPVWLFVNEGIYQFGFDEVVSVISFNTGHHQQAHDASLRCVLGAPTEEIRNKAINNAIAAKNMMCQQKQ